MGRIDRIWILGSINQDIVACVDRMPAIGETRAGRSCRLTPGGKGANQAVAAHLYSGAASFWCRVGDDVFGQSLRQALVDIGLDLHVTVDASAGTGVAVILVDDCGDNQISVIAGANHTWSAAALPPDGAMSPQDVVVVQNEINWEATRFVLERARAEGARTMLNLAPARPLAWDDLKLVDWLVVNELEFYQVFPAARDFRLPLDRQSRPDSLEHLTVVITLGASGALAIRNNHVVAHVPGHAVSVLDTVGAGDCFVGALAAELLRGCTLESALTFANAAAALSVQTRGVWNSFATRDSVERFHSSRRLPMRSEQQL